VKTFNLGEREAAIHDRTGAWLKDLGETGIEAVTGDLEHRTRKFRAFFAKESFNTVEPEAFHAFLAENVWAYADQGLDTARRAFEDVGAPGIKQRIFRMLAEHQQKPFARVWSDHVIGPLDGAVLTEILNAVYPDQYPTHDRRTVAALADLTGTPEDEIRAMGYVRVRGYADDLWTLIKDHDAYRRWPFNQNYNYPYVDRFLVWHFESLGG